MTDEWRIPDTNDHFIDGRSTPPAKGTRFPSVNPATGEKLGDFARGTIEDVESAVHSAEQGYRAWRSLKPFQRGQCLYAIAQALRARAEEFAYCETLDSGKPLRASKKDVEASARYFEYYAGAADKILGETIPATNDHLVYTLLEPYGVTAHILPWNSPMSQLCRGAAPALAAGNSIVVKPAEQTPYTALLFAELCVDHGLPAGAYNVVTGFGEEVGEALIGHEGVRRITFTGSVETGRRVMRAGADRIVPVTSELGGKSPILVFADADLDAAAACCVNAFVGNSGQSCSAGSRILIERTVYEDVVERMSAIIAKDVSYGPGLDDYRIGPLISETQLERVLSFIESGRSDGARVVCGGARAGGKLSNGYFVEPTLFADVRESMRIFQEEIFGPVGIATPFDDEDQAVTLANGTQYGLVAGIWTKDIARAHRLSKLLEAGQVFVNNYREVNIEVPFGGYKASGIGREKGLEALKHYVQHKAVVIRT